MLRELQNAGFTVWNPFWDSFEAQKEKPIKLAPKIDTHCSSQFGFPTTVCATLWLRCTRKPSFPVPSVSRRTHCCVKWNCRDFHTSNLHCNSMPRHSIHRSVGCTYGFKPRELNLDLDRWGIRYRRDFTFQYLRTTISVHLPCSLNKKQAFSPRMPIRTSKLKQKRGIIWLRWYRQRFSRIGVSSQCVTKRVTVLLKNRRLSQRKL